MREKCGFSLRRRHGGVPAARYDIWNADISMTYAECHWIFNLETPMDGQARWAGRPLSYPANYFTVNYDFSRNNQLVERSNVQKYM
jgi:hypothetical protein